MNNIFQANASNGLDDIFKLQNKSNKLMMMFFYLAQRAMSGDLGAMYEFVRFLGFIINKDKAMQNVQMGRKLVELQEQSRALTQQLLDTPAYKEGDPSVQAAFTKLQSKIQGEQGSISTSQKLIAQMLEEFTQVSEQMTGMTKSMLDARGRELAQLSTWRA